MKGLGRPNISDEDIAAFRAWCLSHEEGGITTTDLLEDFVGGDGQNDAGDLIDVDVSKYEKMLRIGVPRGSVENKMRAAAVDPALLSGGEGKAAT